VSIAQPQIWGASISCFESALLLISRKRKNHHRRIYPSSFQGD
jgi:hypothetical protein